MKKPAGKAGFLEQLLKREERMITANTSPAPQIAGTTTCDNIATRIAYWAKVGAGLEIACGAHVPAAHCQVLAKAGVSAAPAVYVGGLQ